MPGLHEYALGYKSLWDSNPDTHKDCCPIELLLGSYLDLDQIDWRDGDVIFVNSFCCTPDMMQMLAVYAGEFLINQLGT